MLPGKLESLLVVFLSVGAGCTADSPPEAPGGKADAPGGGSGPVEVLELLDTSALNLELADDVPTAELAFYLTEAGPLDWEHALANLEHAREIFGRVGVQLRVHSALRLSIPEDWQRLDPSEMEVPGDPALRERDLYAHLNERRSRLTARTENILQAIVASNEYATDAPTDRVIHVIGLREVPIAYYEWEEEQWQRKVAGTGGLSFPPYMYADRIARDLRGVISISNASSTRTLAHELGHKLINVSHEGIGVCPTFATSGDDLMLYGTGENIPSGPDGRFHEERLHLSPFLHLQIESERSYNRDFARDGRYRDPLYGYYALQTPCP